MSLRPQGVLTAGGSVACAATCFGFLSRFFWILDLFSHFRAQYFVALTIFGLLLLTLRRRRTAFVFLACAAINLSTIITFYLGENRPTPSSTPTLRAMLLNVNTRRGDVRRVRQVVETFDPDIVVLEEISSRWVAQLQWLTKSHPHTCIQPSEDNFGIGLFSRWPLTESDVVSIGEAGMPSIAAIVNTGSISFRLIATHPLPPIGPTYSRLRNDQLDRLADHVTSTSPCILMGDLNVTPWSHHFQRLLKRTGLKDSSQGRGVQPTWPSHNPFLWIPIDHFLHSPHIHVVKREIGPNAGSDHYPVIVDFVINTDKEKK